MCDGAKITFCTCLPQGDNKIIHHKKRKAKENRRKFTWTLNRFSSEIVSPLEGMIALPENGFSETSASEMLLGELNSRNCFDFDYEPIEGDNLILNTPPARVHQFLSFIYKSGNWISDFYDSFTITTTEINHGIVKEE